MDKFIFGIQRFADVIHGDSSQNKLVNACDNTQVYGLSGNDTIESTGKKNILLIGGSGNDVIQMTGGSGTLSGGAGADTFNLNYSASAILSAVIEDIEPDKDKISITYDGTAAPNLSYSISGNNVIWTDAEGYFNVTLKGSNTSSDYYDGDCHEYIWDVFWIVNQERERQGLNQLILSQGLNDATSIRAVELDELYSHERPDGTSCFTAVEKSYSGMGENIYVSPSNPEAAMIGWMNSTGHRENILHSYFKFIGVGYYYYENSTSWKDHWVQMFGGNLGGTTNLSAEEILQTSITSKSGSLPIESSSNEIFIGNTYIGNSGNYKIADNFSGTIRINTDNAVTIDGASANNLTDIKVLAYSESANFLINSGNGNNYLIVERASLHNGDISSWQSQNYNKVTIDSGAGNDIIENKIFYTSISGGAGNDSIYNEGNTSYINGGAGNDSITSKGDNVKIYGGDGNDTLNTEVFSRYNWDIESWESTVHSNATLDGGTGDDVIYNHNSNASISGGAGSDNIKNYNDSVTVEGGADNDIIINGEFFARGGANVKLFGGDGADIITSSGSKSILDGGDGDDIIHNGCYFYEPWNIHYDSSYNGEYDDSLKSSGVTICGGAGNDSIDNRSENVVYIYSAGDGDDTISGYSSSDTIKISGGTYSTASSGYSDVIINVGSGSILLKNAQRQTLNITCDETDIETETIPAGISVKGATLTATTAFTGSEINLADYASTVTKVNASALSRGVSVVGTAAANSLKGGKGADTIFGGAGNDTVSLGGGADVYVYQSGNDLIQDYKVGEDKIKLASASITSASLSGSNVVLKTSAGNLTVKGAKNKKITVIDSNGAETSNVYPLSILPAGLSYDSTKKTLTVGTSYSGAAIDLANFDKATKTVAASSYSKKIQITGNNLGNTILGGKANDTLTGGTKADTIYGGAGADKIYGEAGADKLFGGAGNDTLYGGAGNDTLTGGDGKDFFVYGSGDGNDIIADYTAGTDKIKISSGSISKTAYVSNNVVFTVGRGTLTVRNGRGKKITITDASGKTSTKTYKNGAVYGSSAMWFTADDTNFISGETNLDAVTAEKYSVTQLTAPDAENIFAQDIQPVYSTDKTK